MKLICWFGYVQGNSEISEQISKSFSVIYETKVKVYEYPNHLISKKMLYLQSVFEYSLIFAVLVVSAKTICIEDQETKRNGVGDKVSLSKTPDTDDISSTANLFPVDKANIGLIGVKKHYWQTH